MAQRITVAICGPRAAVGLLVWLLVGRFETLSPIHVIIGHRDTYAQCDALARVWVKSAPKKQEYGLGLGSGQCIPESELECTPARKCYDMRNVGKPL